MEPFGLSLAFESSWNVGLAGVRASRPRHPVTASTLATLPQQSRSGVQCLSAWCRGHSVLLLSIAGMCVKHSCRHRHLHRCMAAKGSGPDVERADDDKDHRSDVGYISRVGPAGRVHLRPGVQHMSPVTPTGSRRLGKAPSAHRSKYSDVDSRGPRFSMLPPPADRSYVAKYGAGQPALSSRLDSTQDVRLDGSMGQEYPESADSVSLVPEPYCQVIRPDQRMRAAAAKSLEEEVVRPLEHEGRWFPSDLQEKVVSGLKSDKHHRNFISWSDSRLRTEAKSLTQSVSGSRHDLLDRLKRLQNNEMMTRDERRQDEISLGREAGSKAGKSSAFVRFISGLDGLSREDIAYECTFRRIDCTGDKNELKQKLHLTKNFGGKITEIVYRE
eukprot:TRINITY_DN108535_c0_g1_i1.p1 TRINITY_DN108535_c0_g1~~TRINITY_DN108535_c0_g1_i1.p1  ORF type:complete len:386 (+),score=43.05 TRINITY_DN108535_c0_g1_i1:29-1186(+)